MKDRPMIFSGPLVQAILEGRKTQTRRLGGRLLEPGDRIWVKETWADNVPGCEFQGGYSYRADHRDPRGDGPAHPMTWKSARFMPRVASRITLEVTEPSRMERLGDITEADIVAEGIIAEPGMTLLQTFMEAWDRLHKPEVCWYVNPWVCVHTFKRVTP